MSWLSSFLADVLLKLVQALVGDLETYLADKKKREQEQADRAAQAKQSVQPLKDAPNDDAKKIDDSADSALNGT